jgi:hypothetical protein
MQMERLAPRPMRQPDSGTQIKPKGQSESRSHTPCSGTMPVQTPRHPSEGFSIVAFEQSGVHGHSPQRSSKVPQPAATGSSGHPWSTQLSLASEPSASPFSGTHAWSVLQAGLAPEASFSVASQGVLFVQKPHACSSKPQSPS